MKIISRHIVKPAEETWKGILPLSILDQVAVVTCSSQIYFYNKPTQEKWVSPSNNNVIIDTLKESLSRVLVPFYPLAGRLSWIGGGRLKLECNAMGADLIEVESSDKIIDFGDFYCYSDSFQCLLPQLDYYEKPIQELPLLAVQLTRFACGGLSVGISMSHVIADGTSSFHFTEEWARLTRGEPLAVTPFLDRRVLQAQDVDESSTTKAQVVDGENLSVFSQLGLSEKNYKKVTPTFALLTKDEIEQLKKVANNENTTSPYTRFEVITAHVWRCVTMARELKGEELTTLGLVVDARARVDPPLPSLYFGNGIVHVEVTSSAGKLISEPLSYACKKIREGKSKVNQEYVMEYIKFRMNDESLTKYQFLDDRGKLECLPSLNDDDHALSVVSWFNIGGRSIDFGWGKEVYYGPPLVYSIDGDFYIITIDDGSAVVGVFVQPKLKFQDYISLRITSCR